MEAVRIEGVCVRCHSFERSVGANEEDARAVFNNDHNAGHGHSFEGESTTRKVSFVEYVLQGMPKLTKPRP